MPSTASAWAGTLVLPIAALSKGFASWSSALQVRDILIISQIII